FDISNLGNAATGNYDVSFYLSGNDLISTNDRFLGSVSLSSLAAGAATGTLTTQLTMPGINDAFWLANGGNGDYTVGMIIDSGNSVAESNEFNNSNQGQLVDVDTLTITGTTAADLVATSANVVLEPQTAGSTFDFEFDISNLGGSATGNYDVSFYLSSNDVISTNDRFLGSVSLSSLAAGAATGTLTTQLTMPGINDVFWLTNGGNGDYTVGMIIDSGNSVTESNEANNLNQGQLVDFDTLPVIGTTAADLVATSANVVLEPQTAGSTFTFEFDISNQGGLSAGTFDVAFYLSSNTTISTSDQLLGTTTLTSLSANNSTGTVTVDLTLPGINAPFWQGDDTYYVGMIVDPNNVINESNEANNDNRGFLIDYDDVIVNDTAQTGQRGNDDFIGTGGADFFQGLRGDDDIFGNGGDDELRGGRGDDFVVGGSGNDIVNGDRGDDILVGVNITNAVNPGSNQIDLLIGGFGDDVFVLGDTNQSYYVDTTSPDYAVIADYTAGEDVIVLHGSASSYSLGTPSTGLPTGTGIFQGTELVAIVQGDTAALSLTSEAFEYL
ncbi:MAG: CARDB domain-containing protein, partial [Cyanobacteria bacterium P01_H01_bin.105]